MEKYLLVICLLFYEISTKETLGVEEFTQEIPKPRKLVKKQRYPECGKHTIDLNINKGDSKRIEFFIPDTLLNCVAWDGHCLVYAGGTGIRTMGISSVNSPCFLKFYTNFPTKAAVYSDKWTDDEEVCGGNFTVHKVSTSNDVLTRSEVSNTIHCFSCKGFCFFRGFNFPSQTLQTKCLKENCQLYVYEKRRDTQNICMRNTSSPLLFMVLLSCIEYYTNL